MLPTCSLAYNNLTNDGKDMSGIIKLCEALPQSSLTSLKCAALSLFPPPSQLCVSTL